MCRKKFRRCVFARQISVCQFGSTSGKCSLHIPLLCFSVAEKTPLHFVLKIHRLKPSYDSKWFCSEDEIALWICLFHNNAETLWWYHETDDTVPPPGCAWHFTQARDLACGCLPTPAPSGDVISSAWWRSHHIWSKCLWTSLRDFRQGRRADASQWSNQNSVNMLQFFLSYQLIRDNMSRFSNSFVQRLLNQSLKTHFHAVVQTQKAELLIAS